MGRNRYNPQESRRRAVALLAEGVGRNLFGGRVSVGVLPVALLAEGVGRNRPSRLSRRSHSWVALLAEGVGRNPICSWRSRSGCWTVALLAEGVGRNEWWCLSEWYGLSSPSSRRAWVEIFSPPPADRLDGSPSSRRAWVEITRRPFPPMIWTPSPSSRRAWVEIGRRSRCWLRCSVALLAEGVGRNL